MKRNLIQGVGVNDADYKVVVCETINGKSKQTWVCPFYCRWKDMLKRCYSEKFHKTRPTYKDVSCCDEWLTFSNFKDWMEKQDWQGKQLDKDILGNGKLYSPDTCIFVSPHINVFVEWTTAKRDLPRGVCWCKEKERYKAYGAENGKTKYLGQSSSVQDCHLMWVEHKISLTDELLKSTLDEGDLLALNTYRESLITIMVHRC